MICYFLSTITKYYFQSLILYSNSKANIFSFTPGRSRSHSQIFNKDVKMVASVERYTWLCTCYVHHCVNKGVYHDHSFPSCQTVKPRERWNAGQKQIRIFKDLSTMDETDTVGQLSTLVSHWWQFKRLVHLLASLDRKQFETTRGNT